MAGNIRVVNYQPKRDPNGADRLSVVFLFPVENPKTVAEAVAEKTPEAAQRVNTIDGAPSELADWKAPPSIVRYERTGATTQVAPAQIDPMVSAILSDDEKAAVEAGTLALSPVMDIALDASGTVVTIQQIKVDTAGVVADLMNPASKVFRALNLMWNQAHKDFNVGFDAQRAVVGLRLDEVVIEDLAKIPAELQPDFVPEA